MIMNLQATMPGAVITWLAFLKLEDDSRALKTVRRTDFRMNGSEGPLSERRADYAIANPGMTIKSR